MILPDTPVSIEALRDGGERRAGLWLWLLAAPVLLAIVVYSFATLGIVPLAVVASAFVGEHFALAWFKLNGVRVSPRQFPEIDAAADNFASRLGMTRPDVYVVQDSVFNAFAARLAGRKVIVLYSGAVDSILRTGDAGALAFLLGHEFGHHAAGHLSLAHRMQRLGAWFIWVGLWHRRRMELTCDRVGLALVGDRALALRALAHMAVGSELAPRLDVAEAIAQLRSHQGEFFVGYRVFYSLYPSHLHRLEQLAEMALDAGARAMPLPALGDGEFHAAAAQTPDRSGAVA